MERKPIISVPDAELVIGLVAPVGTGLSFVTEIIQDRLKLFRYQTIEIKVSDLIKRINSLKTKLIDDPESERLRTFMDAGNELRSDSGRGDYLALSAIAEIAQRRPVTEPVLRPRQAYILRSLKHPDEVLALREVYGPGFFLIGVNAPRNSRLNYLVHDKGIELEKAEGLIKRDEHENTDHGQHTRDAFELADAFVASNQANFKRQIWRILDLLFGNPTLTPTPDEYAMFLAYAASVRSADLSRQVGAVIRSQDNEIISTGANDVPRFGGGLYWPDELQDDKADEISDDESGDQRDYRLGYDSNARQRNTMIVNVARKYEKRALIEEKQLWDEDPEGVDLQKGKELLEGIGVSDITEYSRAVHAEMEALLASARSGTSPRGGTLFCTTFPCHNCAKHIVASGIVRVVYVEPYPKSQAIHLHGDSIDVVSPGGKIPEKVRFEPFVGVGPRRYIDLFSLSLSAGRMVKRNYKGRVIPFNRSDAMLRDPMLPIPYVMREKKAIALLSNPLEIDENGNSYGSST